MDSRGMSVDDGDGRRRDARWSKGRMSHFSIETVEEAPQFQPA